MLNCANCGQPIGSLETPYVYRDQTVCVQCWAKLAPRPVDYEAPNARREPTETTATEGGWSPITLAGAVVFGALFLAILGAGIAKLSKGDDGGRSLIASSALPFIMFLLCFVRRAF